MYTTVCWRITGYVAICEKPTEIGTVEVIRKRPRGRRRDGPMSHQPTEERTVGVPWFDDIAWPIKLLHAACMSQIGFARAGLYQSLKSGCPFSLIVN